MNTNPQYTLYMNKELNNSYVTYAWISCKYGSCEKNRTSNYVKVTHLYPQKGD